MKKGHPLERKHPVSIKTLDHYYSMGRPQKIGGSYHQSNRKTINGY
ncbi:hypothetical protein ABIC37_005276 [Priestia megaterium]